MLHAVFNLEVLMPAIASLEDLKAAQKEGVSIYAMPYALCAMLYANGVESVGKMCVGCGSKNVPRTN